jgi:hypothetical protein
MASRPDQSMLRHDVRRLRAGFLVRLGEAPPVHGSKLRLRKSSCLLHSVSHEGYTS